MHGSLTTLALMAVLVTGPMDARASAQAAPETVKAAFVFNVLNFVEWPSQVGTNAPLRIAVIAPKPPTAFVAGLKGRSIRGRTLAVQTYDSIEALDHLGATWDPDSAAVADVFAARVSPPGCTAITEPSAGPFITGDLD